MPPTVIFPAVGPLSALPREQGYIYRTPTGLSIVYAKHFFVTWRYIRCRGNLGVGQNSIRMQRAFSREVVILLALVGLIAGYSAWNARRAEPPVAAEASPMVLTATPESETPEPVVVQGTPVPKPKPKPPHVAVKKKPRPSDYNPPSKPYSAPPRAPGGTEEGGDSLIIH